MNEIIKIRGMELNFERCIQHMNLLDEDPIMVFQYLVREVAKAKDVYRRIANDVSNCDQQIKELEATKTLEFGSKDSSNPLLMSQNRLTNDVIKSAIAVLPEMIQLDTEIIEYRSQRQQIWDYIETINACIDFSKAYLSRPSDNDPDREQRDERFSVDVASLFDRAKGESK